jgi:hypothetical protein
MALRIPGFIMGLSVCLSIYLYSCCPHLEHRASVKRFVSLRFLNLRQLVGLLGRGISLSQGRYLHRTTQTQNKRTHPCLKWDSEPTIPVFERAKKCYALDSAYDRLLWVNLVENLNSSITFGGSLTPWNWALPGKPPVAQPLPTFYGTRRFRKILPQVHILSQINPVHNTPSYVCHIKFQQYLLNCL